MNEYDDRNFNMSETLLRGLWPVYLLPFFISLTIGVIGIIYRTIIKIIKVAIND